MSISLLLIPLALVLLGISVWALFWAVDHGQFDDLEQQGRSVLDDETEPSGS